MIYAYTSMRIPVAEQNGEGNNAFVNSITLFYQVSLVQLRWMY